MLAGLAGVAWLLATFDGPRIQRELVEQVSARLDRRLEIAGGLSLSVLPVPALEARGVTLSGAGGQGEFAAMELARVSVAVLPLLAGRLVVREVRLDSPRLTLRRQADGRTDFDDLLGPSGRPAREHPPHGGLAVEIAELDIRDGRVQWHDERTGRRLEASGVTASARGLGRAEPAPVRLQARLRSAQPAADLALQARLAIALDPAAGRWSVSDLELALKGSTGAAPASVEAKLVLASIAGAPGALQGGPATLALRHSAPGGTTNALDAALPAFASRDGALGPVAVAMTVGHAHGRSRLQARLALPLSARLGMDGPWLARLEASDLRGDLEGQVDGRAVQAALRARAALDPSAGVAELDRLSIKASLAAADMRAGAVTLALDARGRHGPGGRLAFEGAGLLGDGALRVSLARPGPTDPLAIDLEVDQLDLDRLRPSPATGPPVKPAPGADARIDLAGLQGLALEARLRAGQLRAGGVRLSSVRMDVTARNGRLTVAPVLAAVHGGRIEAAAALWQEETPRASLRLSLAGVRVGPLLDELAGRGLLDGRAQLRAELSAAGVDRAAMLRSLAGTAALQVSDGRLRGVDITALFREAGRAPAVAGGEATPAPAGETGFSDLRIGFAIRDAIARSSDLAMRSPLLRVGGEGSVDLAAGTIDYLLRPTLVASLAGQGGRAVLPGLTVPIRVRGPLASPGFAVEWSALLPGALQRPIGQLRERLPEAPGRAIRNLLDR